MPADLHASDGQATLEWLTIIALVGTLLAFGAALAQANGIGRRVTRELARALCLVSHGDCARDREPCVVTADSRRDRLTAHLLFVRLRDGRLGVIEHLSDGTVAVTAAKEGAIGLEAHAGAAAAIRVGIVDAQVTVGVDAAEVLTREGGSTWFVGSDAEARDLLRRLPVGVPPADITYTMTDLESTLGASAAVRAAHRDPLSLAALSLVFDRRTGQRVDRRTGRRTLYARSSQSHDLSAGGGVLGIAGATGGEVLAVELDAEGRPVDLQITATGAYGVSTDLPGVVQPVAGMLTAKADGDRVYEVTGHLDLTDPANLAAAADLLAALRRRGPYAGRVPAASQALRRRLDERGTVEVRVLDSHRSTRELELGAALGAKLGVAYLGEARSTRLIAAQSRGLDGRWLAREDCVAPAA